MTDRRDGHRDGRHDGPSGRCFLAAVMTAVTTGRVSGVPSRRPSKMAGFFLRWLKKTTPVVTSRVSGALVTTAVADEPRDAVYVLETKVDARCDKLATRSNECTRNLSNVDVLGRKSRKKRLSSESGTRFP